MLDVIIVHDRVEATPFDTVDLRIFLSKNTLSENSFLPKDEHFNDLMKLLGSYCEMKRKFGERYSVVCKGLVVYEKYHDCFFILDIPLDYNPPLREFLSEPINNVEDIKNWLEI